MRSFFAFVLIAAWLSFCSVVAYLLGVDKVLAAPVGCAVGAAIVWSVVMFIDHVVSPLWMYFCILIDELIDWNEARKTKP